MPDFYFRALISSALLMLFSTQAAAYDKQSAMDAAKEEAAKLSIKDILTESSASDTVPEYGSDVSELKDLFAKGQGNLLTPGTSKADGCLSQTSMDCRAVQVIYDTHSRPGWEESDFDNILADRDHLLNKVPDLPSNGQEICETITTTRPPQTDFAVCEETTLGSSTQSCFEGWTEKLDVSTLFECIARTGKKLTVECLADYNETSQDYTCLHTPPQTCHVGEKVEIQSTYQYRCKTQQFEQNTYRCNRYLEVVGYSGCEIGKFFEAQSETSSSLGKDACNGGDVIELKYQCSNDLIPRLRIETNVKIRPTSVLRYKRPTFRANTTSLIAKAFGPDKPAARASTAPWTSRWIFIPVRVNGITQVRFKSVFLFRKTSMTFL
ncbi:hypothetical protein [uncultured Parasutterella sp.]|jgi:hypothetical protein|uniref:hypothetical protein n=1 Tax=uncultured Parasutterella sp. TaxID=1263098 RepID=UPI0025E4E3C8|nr:hypothetical protein [uncultured Parasutterella sp.]